jgi:beta-lactam-binding protein with PASTA domain/serine/threonine protein kinase
VTTRGFPTPPGSGDVERPPVGEVVAVPNARSVPVRVRSILVPPRPYTPFVDLRVSAAPVGHLLDRRYRVEATLARGGMATVYRAVDVRLDRVVALKVMHPELAADEEFVARFIAEARSAARLSHPAVVSVFDQGEDGDAVYLAMEYIEGRTLRQVLRDQGRLSPTLALDVIDPVLAALEAAHTGGIVHRDVKPENVLVGDDGRVKVADFGLARALTNASTATRGLLLGTVNYISPEQALGEMATPRSDVYSAGVMLYELLTGRPPHTGPTDFVVVRRHIEHDVPPPSLLEPDVPPHLDALVRQATQREPAHRFTDAGEFLAAVRLAHGGLDPAVPGLEPRESAGVSVAEALTSVVPHASASAPAPIRQPRHASSVSDPIERRPPRQRSRWRGPILFMSVLLLAAGLAAGAWWYGSGRYTATPSLIDLTVDEARAAAAEEGLTVEEAGSRFSEVVDPGLVVATEPEPGERILHDGTIKIYTSQGPERYVVPDVVGMTTAEAQDALAAASIQVDEIDEEFHEEVPKGVVISQSAPPGDELRRDMSVSIAVSKGRQPIEIEDFTGRPFADAEKALTDAGFEVVAEQRADSSVPAGTVISQDPASGTGFRGDEIRLQVSGGEKLKIPVPRVVGMDVAAARLLLNALGFEVDVRNRGVGREVSAQNPRAGQLLELGSTVRLQLGR